MTDAANPGSDGHESGMALVLVVWILGMLAGLGVVANRVAVAGQAEANLALNRARADLAVSAGLNLATAAIQENAARAATGMASVDLGRLRVSVRFASEAGRIDVNRAGQPMLKSLLVSLGAEPTVAAELATAIVRWRRPGGDRSAPEPGESLSPRGPFADPLDIANVPGISASLAAAMQPLITVLSGSDKIDPRIATRSVLLALPGATPQRVGAYLKAKEQGLSKARATEKLGEMADYLTFSTADCWRVAIAIEGSGTEPAYYSATILTSVRADEPYDVLRFTADDPSAWSKT